MRIAVAASAESSATIRAVWQIKAARSCGKWSTSAILTRDVSSNGRFRFALTEGQQDVYRRIVATFDSGESRVFLLAWRDGKRQNRGLSAGHPALFEA